MPIISKRKVVKIGCSSFVTIPNGHTILEKGKAVQTIANSVVVYAPENYTRDRLKDDLRRLVEDL